MNPFSVRSRYVRHVDDALLRLDVHIKRSRALKNELEHDADAKTEILCDLLHLPVLL